MAHFCTPLSIDVASLRVCHPRKYIKPLKKRSLFMCRLDQTVGFLFPKFPSDPRIRLMAKLVLLDEVSLWFIKLGTGNFANGTKGYFNPSLRRCHRLFWQMSTQGHLSFRDTFQQIRLPAKMRGQLLFSTIFVVMPYSIKGLIHSLSSRNVTLLWGFRIM